MRLGLEMDSGYQGFLVGLFLAFCSGRGNSYTMPNTRDRTDGREGMDTSEAPLPAMNLMNNITTREHNLLPMATV